MVRDVREAINNWRMYCNQNAVTNQDFYYICSHEDYQGLRYDLGSETRDYRNLLVITGIIVRPVYAAKRYGISSLGGVALHPKGYYISKSITLEPEEYLFIRSRERSLEPLSEFIIREEPKIRNKTNEEVVSSFKLAGGVLLAIGFFSILLWGYT